MNRNTHFKLQMVSFGLLDEVGLLGAKLQIVSVNVGYGSPNAGITDFVLLVSSELVLATLFQL